MESDGYRKHHARSETVHGAGGQGGDDVRVVEWQNTVSGKLKVKALNDMDGEVTALEATLSTAREVKAGMMSVLLTGKIRLVES